MKIAGEGALKKKPVFHLKNYCLKGGRHLLSNAKKAKKQGLTFKKLL